MSYAPSVAIPGTQDERRYFQLFCDKTAAEICGSPHGLADADFDALFTTDKPVIFAFHGYPTLIHRLTYRRRNHDNIHVRGYVEEGTTTTPFDMVVLNRMDRYRLTLDVVRRVPRLAHLVEQATQQYSEIMQRHKEYVSENGEDLPEVRNWMWSKS